MTTVLSSASTSGFGINNYGDLKEKIALWLNRTNLDDVLPDFVRLAETTIRRDIRTRAQEAFEADTATEDTIACPDLLLEVRRLTVGGKKYEYITPEQYQDRTDSFWTTGRYYTVIGSNIYVLGGATGQDYSLLYWEAYEAFSVDTDTNWLLLNAPGVYLWAGCCEGAEYLKDFEAASRFRAKYNGERDSLNKSEKEMRLPGGALRVRVAGSTP